MIRQSIQAPTARRGEPWVVNLCARGGSGSQFADVLLLGAPDGGLCGQSLEGKILCCVAFISSTHAVLRNEIEMKNHFAPSHIHGDNCVTGTIRADTLIAVSEQ